jgi:hypothetical protein
MPATRAGTPANETLLAGETNLNIAPTFSLDHSDVVAQAYLTTLEKLQNPLGIAYCFQYGQWTLLLAVSDHSQ